MNIFRNLRYVNKELAILLILMFAATAGASVYLSRTIFTTRGLLNDGASAVSATLILQDLEIKLQTTAAAGRGYIISGEPSYLQVYNSAVKTIPASQTALSNPEYGITPQHIKSLNDLITKRLDDLRHDINMRQSQGLAAAAAAFDARSELQTSAQIGKLITSITQQKIRAVEPTLRGTRRSLNIAIGVAIAILVIVSILCLLILWYWQKIIAKERAMENVKNEFLSLASHQLRTPATNIKQHLGLLLEGYLGKLSPQQISALKVANLNNETEIHIINDLLDVAKLDLNKIRLSKKPTNMYRLTKEVVDAYRPTLRKRRQTIKITKADKKLEAPVDPAYMKGVIENLLDNASKYSNTKTSIQVSLRHVRGKVCLSVKDQGIGVSKKDMPKLFKKFSRIPNHLSENIETTGLGLYWVKQIVDLHGGRVTAKSQPGRGSTFYVELPAAKNYDES